MTFLSQSNVCLSKEADRSTPSNLFFFKIFKIKKARNLFLKGRCLPLAAAASFLSVDGYGLQCTTL